MTRILDGYAALILLASLGGTAPACSSSSSGDAGATAGGGSSGGTSSGDAMACTRELDNANYNCDGTRNYCVPSGQCADAGACPGKCSTNAASVPGAPCYLDSDCAVGLLCLTTLGHVCSQAPGCVCTASSHGRPCATNADCDPAEWSCYNPYGLDDGCADGGTAGPCWCQCNGCNL